MNTSSPLDTPLAALTEALWAERTLVEQLAFKHTALELVLAADIRRYVGRCLDEVDAAADRVEEAELRRQAVLEELAATWGRPAGELTLDVLAAEAPEPWATVLGEHRDHIRGLILEITTRARSTAALTTPRLRELDDDLARLTGSVSLTDLLAAGDPAPLRRPGLRLVPVAAGGRGVRP